MNIAYDVLPHSVFTLFSTLPGRHKEAEDWVWPIKDIMVLVVEY